MRAFSVPKPIYIVHYRPARQLPASNNESLLVKSHHPIGEIAVRMSQVHDGFVRLSRESATQNGSPVTAIDDDVASPLSPAEATIAALTQPIDFPPLSAGIVPGDRLAIALDAAVPCPAEIVRGAIKVLEKAGVEPDSISVVSCDVAAIEMCRDVCSGEEPNGVKFVVHDSDDDKDLCLVGLTKRGEPIVVNRVIFDADVVLPIGWRG